MNKPSLNNPVPYYGGKSQVLPQILKLIPKHSLYCEPFCGGLSVFFNIPWVVNTIKVVNDTDFHVYIFFKELRDNRDELLRVIDDTVYSKKDHDECLKILKNNLGTNLEIARAFYFCLNSSILKIKINTFHCSSRHKTYNEFAQRKKVLRNMSFKLKSCYVENRDAIKVISIYDKEKAFFYVDPPYPKTNQGSYRGYKLEDFNNLCEVLKNIKGKFLLSFYKIKGMNLHKNWRIKTFTKNSSASNDIRSEFLAMNF